MVDDYRKLIVVTGGSGGVGRLCVNVFAQNGWRVLFTYYRKHQEAKDLVELYCSGTVRSVRLDQGDFRNIQDFALEVDKWREGKPIDGLINNAAMGSGSVIKYVADALDRSAEENHLKVSSYTGYNHTTRSLLHQHALEDEALMRVNSLGPMWVTEALLPFMATKLGEESPKRSVVLFLGSVGGSEIHKGFRVADCMSKAALIRGVKQMANVHSHDSIDIMCISPGATNTKMLNASLGRFMDDNQLNAFVHGLPKGRLIDPEDIASTIYWLVSSPASRIFHGANLDASQGLAVCPETAQFPASPKQQHH